jgi:hypothetical protein
VSRPATPFAELSPVTHTVAVPWSPNVSSGVPSGSRRITDISVTLPGGASGGVVPAVPDEHEPAVGLDSGRKLKMDIERRGIIGAAGRRKSAANVTAMRRSAPPIGML